MLFLALCFVFLAVAVFAIEGFHIFKKSYAAYEERYLSKAAGVLDEMFVFLPPEQVLYLNFLSIFIMAVLGFIIGLMGPWPVTLAVSLVFGITGYAIPKVVLKQMLNKRVKKFNEQLVDGLSTIANALKAGFSFMQAIDTLVHEMPAPLSQEFGLVLRENKMGVTLDTALNNLSERIKSEDLDLVITSVLTARQVGGNLAEIFDRIAETIRERSKLQGKINALTAQGKMQGIIVGLLPIGLGFIMYKINPDLMKPLFTEPLGWCCLALVVVLEIVGALLIKKIISIDV